MDAKSPRWHRVTPSAFQWEAEAIEFLRSRVAYPTPDRAWSNFEFNSGGTIVQVNVLPPAHKAPLIEGQPVPLLGASEWIDITDARLTNRHRHHAPTGTDTFTSR